MSCSFSIMSRVGVRAALQHSSKTCIRDGWTDRYHRCDPSLNRPVSPVWPQQQRAVCSARCGCCCRAEQQKAFWTRKQRKEKVANAQFWGVDWIPCTTYCTRTRNVFLLHTRYLVCKTHDLRLAASRRTDKIWDLYLNFRFWSFQKAPDAVKEAATYQVPGTYSPTPPNLSNRCCCSHINSSLQCSPWSQDRLQWLRSGRSPQEEKN